MNWEAIGAVGEILGAIAVFASLMYLAIQIRTQNKESKLSATREFSDNLIELQECLSSNSELASVMTKAVSTGIDTLTDSEALQCSAYLQQTLRTWENSYYQFHDDRLDGRLWHSIEVQLSEVASTTAFQQFWKHRAHYYSEDFRNYINQLELNEYRLVSELVRDDT